MGEIESCVFHEMGMDESGAPVNHQGACRQAFSAGFHQTGRFSGLAPCAVCLFMESGNILLRVLQLPVAVA
ncbi:hypothetical protein ACFO1V_00500 [Daeguia caeni]|uniref:Uncharacterized protein n=1 Tax=Daeguia caeni TaxID=439612 RepID=A0ABV9H1N7_9HYPH